jgi:hypothetical protein
VGIIKFASHRLRLRCTFSTADRWNASKHATTSSHCSPDSITLIIRPFADVLCEPERGKTYYAPPGAGPLFSLSSPSTFAVVQPLFERDGKHFAIVLDGYAGYEGYCFQGWFRTSDERHGRVLLFWLVLTYPPSPCLLRWSFFLYSNSYHKHFLRGSSSRGSKSRAGSRRKLFARSPSWSIRRHPVRLPWTSRAFRSNCNPTLRPGRGGIKGNKRVESEVRPTAP